MVYIEPSKIAADDINHQEMNDNKAEANLMVARYSGDDTLSTEHKVKKEMMPYVKTEKRRSDFFNDLNKNKRQKPIVYKPTARKSTAKATFPRVYSKFAGTAHMPIISQTDSENEMAESGARKTNAIYVEHGAKKEQEELSFEMSDGMVDEMPNELDERREDAFCEEMDNERNEELGEEMVDGVDNELGDMMSEMIDENCLNDSADYVDPQIENLMQNLLATPT